jgi:inosine/xanthosine triphosphatase
MSVEKIVIASTNPVKIEAALGGFQKMFPDREFTASGISVPSGVNAQPMTSDETYQGALNRANAVRQSVQDAQYWIGIEGGIEEQRGEMEVFAWVVVLSQELVGKSRTASFYLPQEVAHLIRVGVELGEADDIVFGRSNSKQQNGSVGLLTDDVITRHTYYEHAVILALVPFKNRQLTFAALRDME